jgi:hypothetical protein
MIELLQTLNEKYLNELRSDPEKMASFLSTDNNVHTKQHIRPEQVRLVVVLGLVQTALIKLLVSKQQGPEIFKFFDNFGSQDPHARSMLHLEVDELKDYVDNTDGASQSEIGMSTKALLLECAGMFQEALNQWKKVHSSEACKRTIQILKRENSRDYVNQYAKWIFAKFPEEGLALFKKEPSRGDDEPYAGKAFKNQQALSMTVDQIIEFLKDIERTDDPAAAAGGRRTAAAGQPNQRKVPLLQKYLENVTDDPDEKSQYFTELGKILVDNCKPDRMDTVHDRTRIEEARREL